MALGPVELMAKARGRNRSLGELCAVPELPPDGRPHRARPRLRERVELSDVVQEALVEVVRRNSPSSPGRARRRQVGWLRRLVGRSSPTSAATTAGRSSSAGGADVPLDAPYSVEAGGSGSDSAHGGRLLDMLALSQTSPSEAASRRELVVLLADALADLSESEAEVLWLYHAEGLSFETIGERST
ncbi:MAG: RNA polymerase subunit sigma-70 [Isosphaeraceae bacterium]